MINTLTKIKQIRVKDKDSQILFDPIDIHVDYTEVDVKNTALDQNSITLKSALERGENMEDGRTLKEASVLKRIDEVDGRLDTIEKFFEGAAIGTDEIDKALDTLVEIQNLFNGEEDDDGLRDIKSTFEKHDEDIQSNAENIIALDESFTRIADSEIANLFTSQD